VQTFYTVRQGESLYSIAKRWELPVAALIAANNLTPPYLLYPGQQLSVPPGIRRLQVRAGDTVYELSKEYGVPSQLIIETNRLAPPYELQIDQWLTLPIGLPYYVVQPGDSLYTIGLRFNVASGRYIRTDLIQEANRLPSEQVTPGMRLIIPYAPTGESGIIAYTTNRGGSFDIWLYDPASGQSVPLSSGLGESFTVPFWSPDGSRIAFVGSWNRLYVVEVSTAGVMEVAGKVDPGAYISWSPDGKRLAFPLPDGIALFTLATTRTSILPLPSAEYAQWFPTGDRLLYSQTDEAGNGQLYEVRVDGTSSRQLTNYTGGLIHNVRLSPDGLSALFTSPGASISLVHTVRLADGVIKVLQGGPLGKNYDPVWLAVGSLVAYSSTVFSERKGYFSSIQTEAASGGDRRIWAVSDCFASPVDGSPGGDVLAYLSGCRGDEGQATELWTVSGRHPVPILAVAGGFLITSVKWSRSEASRLPPPVVPKRGFSGGLSLSGPLA